MFRIYNFDAEPLVEPMVSTMEGLLRHSQMSHYFKKLL